MPRQTRCQAGPGRRAAPSSPELGHPASRRRTATCQAVPLGRFIRRSSARATVGGVSAPPIRPRTLAIIVPPLFLAAVVAVLLLESDLPLHLGRIAGAGMHVIGRLGVAGSFLALYLEESGVPLPVSGDVFVVYLGHRAAGSLPRLVLVWLGLVVTVLAGSSNLYFISRRWGRRLVEGRLGIFLHVTPARLAAAERWFNRWGAPAIIFGRHIIGFRVPVTVAAGVFRVPYHVFAISVAVSTAVWAAVWLWLGVAFGHQIAVFLAEHRWAYALLLLGLALGIGAAVLRTVRGEAHR
jgi:membrane-associated protein